MTTVQYRTSAWATLLGMGQAMEFFSDTPFSLTPDALRNVGVNFEVRLPDGSGYLLQDGRHCKAHVVGNPPAQNNPGDAHAEWEVDEGSLPEGTEVRAIWRLEEVAL